MAPKKPTKPNPTAKSNSSKKAKSAVQMGEWMEIALSAAEQLGMKSKPLTNLSLSPEQRDGLLAIPSITRSFKNRLAKNSTAFTVAEVISMIQALGNELPTADTERQVLILHVAKHLMECLKEGVVEAAEPVLKPPKIRKAKADPKTIYQFRITLTDSKPSIWRRIQVRDCSLDKLHEHIQTAMGWTNSHLHEFEIGGERYGDPQLLNDEFDEIASIDSTITRISDIIPTDKKRFSFEYQYDFGDCWDHEILFEGSPVSDPKAKYPICLEGERACPPEDCGGLGGFYELLKAIKNPRHERHEELLEWIGGQFDPAAFDAGEATKAMKKGLPNWRD